MNKSGINRVARRFELFKAGLRKNSYLQMTNNNELFIEGCLSVKDYDENKICLRLPKNELTIVGFSLVMKSFSSDGVIIRGQIMSLDFQEADNAEKK